MGGGGFYDFEYGIESCQHCHEPIKWRRVYEIKYGANNKFEMPAVTKPRFKCCARCASKEWAVILKAGRLH